MSGYRGNGSSIQRLVKKIKASIASTKFSEEPLILGSALLIMLILILYAFGAFNTQGEIWNTTYGGPGFDTASSVQQTSDGGYIIVGATNSYGSGGYDAWLIRTKSKGSELWNSTYGGLGDDSGVAVMEIEDGGWIIAGKANSFGAGDFDAWLLLADSDGKEIWNETFGGSGSDGAFSFQKTADGGYIIVGQTESYGAGGSDVWLIKTDLKGAEVWNATFGGSRDDSGRSIQETDGGYVITGFTESYGAGDKDIWLIKTDLEGDEVWNVTFGSSRDDIGESVQLLVDGGYIIAGGANVPPDETLSAGDAWLIRTDSNGTMLWGKIFSYGDSTHDIITSVMVEEDGGYIAAGWSSDRELYAWLIKTDNSGVKQWDMLFNETAREVGSSIQRTQDSSYITTGWKSFSGNADVWLSKIKMN